MKCINCGKEFESQRSSAKFCSSKCRVSFSRKDSVTDSVTKVVTTPGNNVVTEEPPFIPNWKRNKYHNYNDALKSAIGDVLQMVPGATLVLGDVVYTNLKIETSQNKRAEYCPKHNKIKMGNLYECGCKVNA